MFQRDRRFGDFVCVCLRPTPYLVLLTEIGSVEEEGRGNQHTQGSVDHKVVTGEEEIYSRWRRLPAVGSNGANLRLPRVSNKASAIDAWSSGGNFLFSLCDVVFGYWPGSNLGLNVRIGLFVAL
ncbi:unnamed protein product [Cochlearia groenlandica]